MKRKIMTIIGCFLAGAASMSASNELVIHLTSGAVQRFVLLEEDPTINFIGDNIIVTTSSTETTYAMDDVEYFNYENNTATMITEADRNDGISINGDKIVISGLPKGCKVMLYGGGGQLCDTIVADENGTAVLSLSALPRGVYIINANGNTSKITKKN